jgi:hypothetical protein
LIGVKLTWLTSCSNPFQLNSTDHHHATVDSMSSNQSDWWMDPDYTQHLELISNYSFLRSLCVCVCCRSFVHCTKLCLDYKILLSTATLSSYTLPTYSGNKVLGVSAFAPIASVSVGWLNSYCCSNWSAFWPMIYVQTLTHSYTRREPVFRLCRDHIFFFLRCENPKWAGRMLFSLGRSSAGASEMLLMGKRHLTTCV